MDYLHFDPIDVFRFLLAVIARLVRMISISEQVMESFKWRERKAKSTKGSEVKYLVVQRAILLNVKQTRRSD